MYRIPKDDQVIIALRDVLAKYKTVHSQQKLKALVEKELNSDVDDNYRVGEVRMRHLAINSAEDLLGLSGDEGAYESLFGLESCSLYNHHLPRRILALAGDERGKDCEEKEPQQVSRRAKRHGLVPLS